MTFRCSDAARLRGDSPVATAPPARRWLLVEQPGPWPVHALDVFAPEVSRELGGRARGAGVRIVLVRRPGRHPRAAGPVRWAYVDTDHGREGLRWHDSPDHRALAAAPWVAGGDLPVALVCAHSRHDVCCAVRGHRLAGELHRHWPGRVWECSHLGGDRFAPNLVLLPHGLVYGNLDAPGAVEVLAGYVDGRIVPELGSDPDVAPTPAFRGRCGLPPAVQAAQFAAIRATGRTRIDDLAPLDARRLHDGVHEVVLDGRPRLRVRVREDVVALGTPSTCRGTAATTAAAWDTVSVEPLPQTLRR